MTVNRNHDLRILVSLDGTQSGGNPTLRLEGRIVYLDDGDALTPLSSDRGPLADLAGFADLMVSGHMSPYNGRVSFTDFLGLDEVHYGQVFSADLRDLGTMTRTLRTVTRRLAKLTERRGNPRDAADSLDRFAISIGAHPTEPFLIQRKPFTSEPETTHSLRTILETTKRDWVRVNCLWDEGEYPESFQRAGVEDTVASF